jgi:hypothetical protein
LLEFGVNSGAIAGGVTPDISTTVHRRGTASLRSHPTTNQSYIEHQIDSGTVKRTLHRLYLRVDTRPSVDTNVYAIGQAGYFPASLRLLTTGELVLRDSQAGTTLTGTSAVLTLGRWYRVELDYTDVAGTITAGVSAFKAYLDGALFADAMCSNINGWSRVRMGINGVNATADIFLDDIAVNDTTGSVQNGLPGPGCVVHLRPNAAGDNNLWETAVGGTAGAENNWTRINDRPPDDSTSYNQTAATGTTTVDDYNLESAATVGIGSADQITCVQVGGRVSSDAFTAANIVYRLKSQAAGTVVESATVPVNNTGTAGAWSVHRGQSPRPYSLTSYTDPQDGSAWTAAKLDNAQIGVRGSVSQTTIRRVSNLWALVDFVPRFALGVAQETATTYSLDYEQSAFPVATLVDDFNDNTIDTALWPNSFGNISETGGKAHVAVDTGYNAFSSAKAYRLKNSRLVLEVFPPTLPDGSTEAWAQALIKSNVEGTDLGFEVGIAGGALVCFNRTGYYDPEAAYITYNATTHRWLRIREAGDQVMWDTSPDGHTWTNRRTVSSPAWVADGDLEVQLIAHRADGTDNFVDFDNVNVLPTYVTSIGSATSTNFGRSVKGVKRRSLGAASASQTAHSLRVVKRPAIGAAGVINTARGATPAKTKGLGTAASGVSALAIKALRRVPVEPGAVVNTGYGLDPDKRRALGNAARTADQASPMVAGKRSDLGAANLAATGHAVRAVHRLNNGRAQSTTTARGVTPVKLLTHEGASTTDIARPISVRKTRVIGAAATEGVSHGLAASHRHSVAPAGSEAVGWPVLARARAHLGLAPSGQTAHALTSTSVGGLARALMTTSGRAVTARKRDTSATPAEAIDSANALTVRKRSTLGVAHEADPARPPAGRVKSLRLGAAPTTATGSGVKAAKRSHLDPAHQTTAANSLRADKLRRLDVVGTVTTARSIAWKRTEHLGTASATTATHPLENRKTRHLVNSAAATHARGVAVRKTRPLGRGTAAMAGLDVRPIKRLILGVAGETSGAHGTRIPVLNRMLNPGHTVEAANAITVHMPRPADTLKPSISGPGLTSGVSEPGLKPSVSGPGLVAYITSGGS